MNDIRKLLRAGLAAGALALVPPGQPARAGWTAPLQQAGPGDKGAQVRITQVDESRFPQVVVYISVTDAAGAPIGIDPDRLTLSENGAAITPDSVGGRGEVGPLTTLLVMDVSGSMNEAGKLEAARAAARAYVDQMRPGDQAGLLTFNTEINYVLPLTTDRGALAEAIDQLKAGDDTALYDALAQAVEILQGVPGRKTVIALTDGLDNRSTSTVEQVLEQIGSGGLSISTVGLGDPSQLSLTNAGLDEAGLQSLAARAGGQYGYADDPDELRGLYERYGLALRSEYAITYTSPAALRDGVNRALTVTLAEAAVAGRAEYNPGGVLPEVAERVRWPLFAAVLAGLLTLLFVPVLATRGAATLAGLRLGGGRLRKKGSRIRLTDPPQAQPRVRLR